MVVLVVIGCSLQSEEVNVYFVCKEVLIKFLLDCFILEIGIIVNLIIGSVDVLVECMKVEGEYSFVDVLIIIDVGCLYCVQQEGQLVIMDSDIFVDQVFEVLCDFEGYWYGLFVCVRVVVYVLDWVDLVELFIYEVLVDEKWDDCICICFLDNIYNQFFIVSLIVYNGEVDIE